MSDSSPLFLNDVFARFAKIRVVRKGEPHAKFYFIGSEAASTQELERTVISFKETEKILRFATSYRFQTAALTSIFSQKAWIPADIVLPWPATWIDNCAHEDDDDRVGALLLNNDNGKIDIILFREHGRGKRRFLGTNLDANLIRFYESSTPFARQLKMLGQHDGILTIYNNLSFDRRTSRLMIQNPQLANFIYREELPGLPLIYDYAEAYKKVLFIRSIASDVIFSTYAKQALQLAQALATENARIKIGAFPAAPPRNESAMMRAGYALNRTPILISANPHYAPRPTFKDKLTGLSRRALSQPQDQETSSVLSSIFQKAADLLRRRSDEPATTGIPDEPKNKEAVETFKEWENFKISNEEREIEQPVNGASETPLQIEPSIFQKIGQTIDLHGDASLTSPVDTMKTAMAAPQPDNNPATELNKAVDQDMISDDSSVPSPLQIVPADNQPQDIDQQQPATSPRTSQSDDHGQLPVFQNEIFARLAKVGLIQKALNGFPYMGRDFLMADKDAAEMDLILTAAESNLRDATSYQISETAFSALNDGGVHMTGASIPARITWIDNIARHNEFSISGGALLVDDGSDWISVTVFLKGAGIIPWETLVGDIIHASILQKISKLEHYQETMLIVAGIAAAKRNRDITVLDPDKRLPIFAETTSSFPEIFDYRDILKNLPEHDSLRLARIVRTASGNAIKLAFAIASNDPRITIRAKQKPSLAHDRRLIKFSRSIRRNPSVVTANPEFFSEPSAPLQSEADFAPIPAPGSAPAIDEAVPADIIDREATRADKDQPDIESVADFPETAAVFTSIVAADVNLSAATPTEPAALPRPLIVLPTAEEQDEREYKRIEAFDEAQLLLLADAEMYLAQAQNRGLNRFECRILLNRPGFPIQLQFSADTATGNGHKAAKGIFMLNAYMQPYTARHIPLTMNDAVDLKIAVQSMICNAEGIVSVYNTPASGQHVVPLDTQMPLPIKDFRVTMRSNGAYSLIMDAQDPYTRKMIHPTMPLGIAARHEDVAGEQRELNDRAQYVIDYLQDITNRRTPDGHRICVTKRDVLTKLQSYVETANKEWVTHETMELPDFIGNTIIYVSANGAQKITLAPVTLRMDAGGDNPSWHASLAFYIGDKTKRTRGERVRTREVNLHTRNPELAKARIAETLLGVRGSKGTQLVEGFLPLMQSHLQSTGAEWRVENKDTAQERVFVGDRELQTFFDDMMRYERDIGLQLAKREIAEHGDTCITLQAMRSLTPDYGATVCVTPEPVQESIDGKRKPVAFTLTVPHDRADKIAAFAAAANEHVSWHADEAYSSVALGTGDQPNQRKKPLEYRTSQIRRSIIRAIEELHEVYFGARLPRKWSEGSIAAAPHKNKDRTRSYRSLHLLELRDQSGCLTAHTHQGSRSCLLLG